MNPSDLRDERPEAVGPPEPAAAGPGCGPEPPVARRQVEILNAYGLHLRPADKFVRLAYQFQAEIRVHYKGHAYNGKSILDLTSLAAECGTRLDLEARGPDAEAALAALADLVAARFHETGEGQYKDAAS
ncbi:MAG TPA: HPr family phosphocarrier protein [Isosphaeraceae bacterium]